MAGIVENHERITDDKNGFIQVEVSRRRVRKLFKVTYHVITEVTDGASEKAWQAGGGNRPVTAKQTAHRIERITLMFPRRHSSLFFHDHAGSADLEHNSRIRADKGVASPFFTPFDAFQQVDVILVLQLF